MHCARNKGSVGVYGDDVSLCLCSSGQYSSVPVTSLLALMMLADPLPYLEKSLNKFGMRIPHAGGYFGKHDSFGGPEHPKYVMHFVAYSILGPQILECIR